MTTMPISNVLADQTTMLRRNLLHAKRYPGMSLSMIMGPVIMLLLFAYVLGGAMEEVILGQSGLSYVDYLVPGILLMTLASGSMPIAVGINTDMTEGIVARFRTMHIARSSVLTGHVVGNVILTMISAVPVLGIAALMGFRPQASFLDWLAIVGLVAVITLALTWFGAALGLVAKNPEGASNIVLPISLLLPFVSSAFVPVESMPGWLQGFSEYQPFTTAIEALRGLLFDGPVGNSLWVSAIWCAVIAVLGYLWAKKLYNRDPSTR